MPKAVTPPLLLAGAVLSVLLLAAPRQTVMCVVVLGDCRTEDSLLWAIICYALLAGTVGLLALVAKRTIDSICHQRTRATIAVQPLRSLPSATAPADLIALLRALHLEERTQVIDLETPVALCHGLLQPRLLLSTGALRALSPAEMEAVLRHERAHLRRRDPLRLVLARALADALPALPILRHMAMALPLRQELAADRVALAAVGAEALGGALLKVGEALGPLHGTTLAIGAFSMLDARIDQLLGVPVSPPSPSPRVVLPVVSVLVLSPLVCLLLPLLWYMALGPFLPRGAGERHREGAGARGRHPSW
jgi:Zn-dependent protease with chaperone function